MNDSEVTISREKHLEMLRGFTFGMDVISGKNFDLAKDFKVAGKTTTVLTLK